MSPQLAIGMNFSWAQTSFNGNVCSSTIACNPANPPSIHIENGHVDFSTLNFDATYTFLDGPIKPLIVAGLGWQWLNTNIASAPPQTGCWWDPWWGYVCSTWQPTHGSSSFTYQVGGGIQFNFSRTFAINADYRYTWFQLTNATGTPARGGARAQRRTKCRSNTVSLPFSLLVHCSVKWSWSEKVMSKRRMWGAAGPDSFVALTKANSRRSGVAFSGRAASRTM